MNPITPLELADRIGSHLQPLASDTFTVRATLKDWNVSTKWARGTLVQHIEGVSTHSAASIRFGMAGWEAQRFVDRAAASGKPIRSGLAVDVAGAVDYHPSFGLQFRATAITVVGESAQTLRHQQVRSDIHRSGQGLNQGNLAVDFQAIRHIAMICPAGGHDGATDAKTTIETTLVRAGIRPPMIAAKPIPMSGPNAMRSLETQVTAAALGTDLVLIVRGGGADDQMTMWNDQRICTALATCPKPIVLGIGHTNDEFNAHMVVHHAAATPTAAATWISDRITAAHQPAMVPAPMPPPPLPNQYQPRPQRSFGAREVLLIAGVVATVLIALAIAAAVAA